MKIIIAPDSFKESMSAESAADAVKQGFQAVFPDATFLSLPIADGGEGTVDALIAAASGERVSVEVFDPLNKPITAAYGLLHQGTTAAIEMAAASGLMLVPPKERNPMLTSSYGTGQLIKNALDKGVQQIILGIGGSATVDGGVGMLQALGAVFYDGQRQRLGQGGEVLNKIASIDISGLDPRLKDCDIDVACDVDNPLVGERGAATVFGPQKGATPEMVAMLERGLNQLANVIKSTTGIDYRHLAGGGAAGGISVAAAAFLGAQLKPGIDIVIQAVDLEKEMMDADLVIVGEGSMDGQTAGGKAPIGVAKVAAKYHVPVIALSGVLGKGVDALHQEGIDAFFSILPRLCALDEALNEGAINLQQTAYNVAKVLKIGQKL
ncbi:glycerate kinase [Providencia stuartii]|uniref:Glycerate kinase n=2 Tax=Enterobacterales TaxID=91347 RepID=A0AAJ1JKF3_PROST|nr:MULTISPECIES: glycerate kinase [Providencia]EMA3639561.1 glycerate kinase [Providencia stuartii]MBW3100858.1 glycerate kinase [Providencia stuartii]MCB5216317.1 glycerate kinase [Providencia stuartii]MDE8749915.1 glycerate kinase [Providencia thailandensis]MDE8769575.1 glycerate kinase [Providencia thailandensis]